MSSKAMSSLSKRVGEMKCNVFLCLLGIFLPHVTLGPDFSAAVKLFYTNCDNCKTFDG